MTERYAKSLVAVNAAKLREAISDALKHERDHIVQHRLGEIVCECRWCEKIYGEDRKEAK